MGRDPIDEVNVTLQRLLRKRIVAMTARARWERVQEDQWKPLAQWQIVAKDPEALTRFYGVAVRLEGEDQQRARLSRGRPQSPRGNQPAASGRRRPKGTTWCQLFVEVDDVDVYIAKATALVAKVIVPKSELPTATRSPSSSILPDFPLALSREEVAAKEQRGRSPCAGNGFEARIVLSVSNRGCDLDRNQVERAISRASAATGSEIDLSERELNPREFERRDVAFLRRRSRACAAPRPPASSGRTGQKVRPSAPCMRGVCGDR